MDDNINKIIFKKFRILKPISSGNFGKVYLGQNIFTKKFVAVKFEDKNSLAKKTLEKEAYYLYNLKGFGIPEIISFGYNNKYNILVESLYGRSLYEIKLKHKFTLKDICIIGIQMIQRLDYIHSKYVIHCDIKPQNCLIGKIDTSNIYICDFGVAQKYRSSHTGKHINMRKLKRIYISPFFSSINAILGYQQSRRDDLESLGYMLIYLINGLPWINITAKNLEEYRDKIIHLKKNISLQKLCEDLPIEIYYYMKYVRELKFEEKPNYPYLQNLFYEILFKINENCDYIFSWDFIKKRIIKRDTSQKTNTKKVPFSNVFHEKGKLIKKGNNSESNILDFFFSNFKLNPRRENKLTEKKRSTYALNYWINIAQKDRNSINNDDKDLEVENNYYVNYKQF